MVFRDERGRAIIPQPSQTKETPQAIQDIRQGITPFQRRLIERKPKPSTPTLTTGQQIRQERLKDTQGRVVQYKNIDVNTTYVYDNGKTISGRDLKIQMGKEVRDEMLSASRIRQGTYVKSNGQYYRVEGETRYLIKHSDPKESRELVSSFGKTGREGLPPGFIGPVLPPS